jgi:inhibitor of cysteine peptidase
MDRLDMFLLLISINILLLVGCGAAQPSTPNEVHLTEKGGDCGSSVELNTGDSLELVLEGNPTTGYTWEIESNDPAVLEPTGEPEFTPDSEALGAGGIYTFRFSAIANGKVTLRLIYRRPFENDVPALKSCEITINVK